MENLVILKPLATIGLIGFVFTSIIFFIMYRWRIRLVYTHLVKTIDCLHAIEGIPGIDRASIIKVEDSGGNISAGSELYATMLHESYSDRVKSIKKDFIRWQLDEQFIKMVLGSRSSSPSEEVRDTMIKGILHNAFVANQIKFSYCFFLTNKRRKQSFYLLVESREDVQTMAKEEVVSKIIAEYSKLRSYYIKAKNWLYL